jgi:hypothetical protein
MSREKFLETAASHLGYHARAGMSSVYGGTVGHQGLPWDGSFVDVVAREAGITVPSCVYPTSGLAEFIRRRRWHAKPQPGDIAFFTFSTGDNFGSPHIGIVTEVKDWKRLGRFRCIEGMVNSGLPNGSPVCDGVFERTRWKTDVLGFGRPDFQLRPGRELIKADGQPVVSVSNVQPGRRNRDIERVQLALSRVTGLRNVKQGAFDGQTQSAYAAWQRQIGYVGTQAIGIPDEASLKRLGDETGYFGLRS